MKLESFFPGRLRVRSELFMKQENLDKIQEYVNAIDGVKEVTANPLTGSITVLYNPSVITMPMLMQAKDELERLESELR
ncbi:MAG: hypothetical protein LIP23_01750 [Planctomycetes bacterium]|nr:hypothetical protein [Planctomycetota bacterium]